jgi:hypothetical protein
MNAHLQKLRGYIIAVQPPTTSNCLAFTALEPIGQLILHSNDQYWRKIEAITVFVLWRERCRRIFSDNSKDGVQLTT